jgi:hypothetical protein
MMIVLGWRQTIIEAWAVTLGNKRKATALSPVQAIRPLALLLGLVSLIAIWLVLFIQQGTPDPLGRDFYPLWLGGRTILAGQNPYSPEVRAYLMQHWPMPFAAAGILYPVPALLAALPFALLPLAVAVPLWVALGFITAGSAIKLRLDWRSQIATLFLFMPLYRAVVMKQATLIWLGLAVVLFLAIRNRKLPLAGLCMAVLPAKPQTGLLFALAAAVWALREDRRLLLWAAAWAVPIWGGAFLVRPNWVQEALDAVALNAVVVTPQSLLPFGLILVLVSWRLPWYAIVAAAQVVLFPLTDIYSTAPLLLGWIAIGGPLAWLGAGISWLWPLLGASNSLPALWVFVLLPYTLCALWRSLANLRLVRAGAQLPSDIWTSPQVADTGQQ